MRNVLYDNFKSYFPWVEEDVVSSERTGPFELTVKLRNGTTAIYSDHTRTMRKLPFDSNNMTEDECRHEFGFRLLRMMTIKGMDKKELAYVADISEISLNNYIKGKTSPSFYAVDKIAKALDCSVDEFRYK